MNVYGLVNVLCFLCALFVVRRSTVVKGEMSWLLISVGRFNALYGLVEG